MLINSFLAVCPYIDDYSEDSLVDLKLEYPLEEVIKLSKAYILSWAEQSVGRAFLIHGKIPEYNGKYIIGLLVTVSEEIEKFYYFLSSPGDWETQTEVVEVSKEDVDLKLFIIFG